jgi:hypothetical protein
MGADAQADAAVDDVAHRHLFAGRFAMEIEDQRVAIAAQAMAVQELLDLLERIV